LPSDLAARRRDFPALDVLVSGRRLAYLDSAATALKPRAVIDAVTRTYTHDAGSPHRAVHALAEAAADVCDDARVDVADWLGASPDEIVFTSGTTASLNLVAQTWARANLMRGDAVIVTEAEHHSNLVPWQLVCAERGAELRVAPVDDAGRIDFDRVSFSRAKLVCVAHVSNVVGTVTPIADVAARAHAAGALVVVDGAQAVAHISIDVRALDCDFYAFSGHKLYGPPGIGVLWARRELLAAMPPWQTGGGMVTSVELHTTRYRDPPARFEAGTPNIAGIAGLGAAIRYARGIEIASPTDVGRAAPPEAARRMIDEARIHARLVAAIRAAGGTILGEPEVAVVSFVMPTAHAHDVATIVDGEGVAVRSGHHCAEPLHRRFGVAASTRASIACYTGDDDIDQLAAALAKVREVFG
jgi:cysteine desulfurase/selenocysteine lyase